MYFSLICVLLSNSNLSPISVLLRPTSSVQLHSFVAVPTILEEINLIHEANKMQKAKRYPAHSLKQHLQILIWTKSTTASTVRAPETCASTVPTTTEPSAPSAAPPPGRGLPCWEVGALVHYLDRTIAQKCVVLFHSCQHRLLYPESQRWHSVYVRALQCV